MSLLLSVLGGLIAATSAHADQWGAQNQPDPGCLASDAWNGQVNPSSDPVGFRNIAYPEAHATYWMTILSGQIGDTLTFKGQFPSARYMGLQAYDADHHLLGAIEDQDMIADAGTNNPYMLNSSADLGQYTATMVFGTAPANPPANTFYTSGLTEVMVLYRVYYSNISTDLAGGISNPALPTIFYNGQEMHSCAPRPILPAADTVNGQLDQHNFVGNPPTEDIALTTQRPFVWMSVTDGSTDYYPSADNNYISAQLSRAFISPPYRERLVVMKLRTPTYPDTQSGEAPWLAVTDRQVRYWSVCSNDMLSTGVVRCVSDNQAATQNGYATFVFSDPRDRPDEQTLARWGATWVALGALTSNQFVYDLYGNQVTAADGAFYDTLILYRQTMANPNWRQSMANIGRSSPAQWRHLMGDYWPKVGYCTNREFARRGGSCAALPRQRLSVLNQFRP